MHALDSFPILSVLLHIDLVHFFAVIHHDALLSQNFLKVVVNVVLLEILNRLLFKNLTS